MSKPFFVYMVVTSRGNLYTGITTDVARRVYEHNHTKRGSKCLRGQRSVKLVWVGCAWVDRSLASKQEYEIKQLHRMEKVKLIMDRWRVDASTGRDVIMVLDEMEELLLRSIQQNDS